MVYRKYIVKLIKTKKNNEKTGRDFSPDMSENLM